MIAASQDLPKDMAERRVVHGLVYEPPRDGVIIDDDLKSALGCKRVENLRNRRLVRVDFDFALGTRCDAYF